MATKVLVPLLGEGVEEVTVTKWLKKEGDLVNELEPLQGPPHPTEPYAALPGARLHEVAVHRYQRRLRSHEHRIPNNQDRSHT